VWVANEGDDTVSRVDVGDPVEPATVATIPVGDGPVDLAVGEDAVWVVNGGGRTISRIDPEVGNVVATIELENQPVRVAAGGGLVWVTVQEKAAS
jgi:streptogramin lyase